MAKSTTTYWNALSPGSRERWTPVKGFEGMAEELTLAHPSASDRIANVLGEHPEILSAARQITGDLLHYSEGEDPSDPHLRRRIIELLDHLAEHERNETDLIQRLEYRELGDGD